jgi:hypothetical protein
MTSAREHVSGGGNAGMSHTTRETSKRAGSIDGLLLIIHQTF